jgi:uncharacterized protein YbaP (TraB family)
VRSWSALRRAFHASVDLIVDALEDDGAEVAVAPKKRRTRGKSQAPIVRPVLSPEREAELDADLKRRGIL